jgi:succinyl-CoA synthetase beta subunit
MMLPEAEGKDMLRSKRIKTSEGRVVRDFDDLAQAWPAGFPVAAKAQVASGGRGKAGGVIRCESAGELRDAFQSIMRTEFAGELPSGVLVEPWLTIERELYLSVVVDGRAGGYSLLYSPTGGVDIESAEVLVEYPFGAPENFRGDALRAAIGTAESDEAVRERVIDLARRLVGVLVAYDCTTVEINPLAVTGKALVAVDAKVVLDDSAASRQSVTADALRRAHAHETGVDAACRGANLVFVPLGGSVGLISGGAGMTMRAMDAIAEAGGHAAGFLDISGNPTPHGLEVAIRSLASLPDVDCILFSIFGGGLDVGRIARSVMRILYDLNGIPRTAFRLSGMGRETADQILAEHGLVNHETLEAAVADLVRIEVTA